MRTEGDDDSPGGPGGLGPVAGPDDDPAVDPVAEPTSSGAFGPFRYRGEQLILEELLLAELASDLAGQPAWVLSRAALDAVFAGPPRCLPMGLVGPLEVPAMAGAAGWWTAVVSSHELDLAERAGFDPSRIAAPPGWRDDGFVKDALTRGIASLPAVDEIDEQNIERIASLLGVERPCSGDVPRDVPPPVGLEAFADCGGLLAVVLRRSPTLVLDTPLDGCALELRSGESVDVLAVDHRAGRVDADAAVVLNGLPGSLSASIEPVALPARLHGAPASGEGRLGVPAVASSEAGPARGDWVVIPCLGAVACLPPDAAHSRPQHILVHGGLWRPLDQRPLPPAAD